MDGLRRGPFHRKLGAFFGFIHILILFLVTKQDTQYSFLLSADTHLDRQDQAGF